MTTSHTRGVNVKTYTGWIVAAAVVMLALAGDPTCPSDIDNNGAVGTSDLLQLLSDWGPCPSPPRLVDAIGSYNLVPPNGFHARLWSDGLIEEFDPKVGGPVWTDVPGGAYTPPDGVRAVSLSGMDTFLVRAWSDGTVEQITRNDDSGPWDPDQWLIVGR